MRGLSRPMIVMSAGTCPVCGTSMRHMWDVDWIYCPAPGCPYAAPPHYPWARTKMTKSPAPLAYYNGSVAQR